MAQYSRIISNFVPGMKKKVFLLMLLAALSLIHGAAQEYVRMPQALKSGDTIAIISPSSTPTRNR
jgi:molybdopterin converting factor small subunit